MISTCLKVGSWTKEARHHSKGCPASEALESLEFAKTILLQGCSTGRHRRTTTTKPNPSNKASIEERLFEAKQVRQEGGCVLDCRSNCSVAFRGSKTCLLGRGEVPRLDLTPHCLRNFDETCSVHSQKRKWKKTFLSSFFCCNSFAMVMILCWPTSPPSSIQSHEKC